MSVLSYLPTQFPEDPEEKKDDAEKQLTESPQDGASQTSNPGVK
jgi:hypothetical protein